MEADKVDESLKWLFDAEQAVCSHPNMEYTHHENQETASEYFDCPDCGYTHHYVVF